MSEEWEKNLSDPHRSAVDASNDASDRVFGIFVSALLPVPRKVVARWVDLQELPWD
jgi:hypothetical protein